MPSHLDSAGRPIVVVTGMGVVTSLGAGKTDNWTKLTAGTVRHPEHHPLRDRGPEDALRRHGRFRPGRAAVGARTVGAACRSRRRRSDGGIRHRQRAAISRGRCSSPCRRSRSNGRSAARWRRPPAPTPMSATPTSCATAASGKFGHHHRALPCSARSPTTSPTGSAPRARRSRCRPPAPPARPRSSSASRRSAAAKPSAALCIGTDGSVNPESLIRFSLLSALSTSNDPPEQAAKPFSKNRDGFVMAEGAGALVLESLEAAHGARREDPRRRRRLRRDGRRLPPHPLEPGRQADHRLHPQRARRRRPDARRHRLHQRARHRHAGERQDGSARRDGRVRRARQVASRSRPTSR